MLIPPQFVVVTASNPGSGHARYVIDRNRLTSPAHAAFLNCWLRSGINVRPTGNWHRWLTRGFDLQPASTLILVDGRRLNVDLSSTGGVALANIERIESAWWCSVLYGDGASGGTINIAARHWPMVARSA
jgi:hypothetical protein